MSPDNCPNCQIRDRRIRELERKLATAELEIECAQQRAERYRERYELAVRELSAGKEKST